MGSKGRAALLFAAIIGLFVVVGGLLSEYLFGSYLAGLLTALTLAAVFNLVSYFFCDRFVLWSTRARIVSAAEAPRLSAIVDDLAPEFRLVSPRIALVPSQSPNAFATGRDERHAVVAATEGIMRVCSDAELRGVIAHELAHIKDRDVLLMTLAATVAGAISYAAQVTFYSMLFGGTTGNRSGVNPLVVLVAALTAPVAALLLRLAISRNRELRADEVGARTTGDPESLARALEKIDQLSQSRPMAFGSPSTSSLFIVNPFRGSGFATLFSTHPPTRVRVERLRAMKADFYYRIPARPAILRAGRGGSAT